VIGSGDGSVDLKLDSNRDRGRPLGERCRELHLHQSDARRVERGADHGNAMDQRLRLRCQPAPGQHHFGGGHLQLWLPDIHQLGGSDSQLRPGFLGFDPKSGQPATWPLRYSMVSWSAPLNGLAPGKYAVRARRGSQRLRATRAEAQPKDRQECSRSAGVRGGVTAALKGLNCGAGKTQRAGKG
jgi:hypothetical protein